MNIQDWSPLRWTGWISLQSKGLSRVFSTTTVQKHQFFGAQKIGIGKFNSDDYCTYYYGQESIRRKGVALRVNKKAWNKVFGCNLKNDRMISVHLQGKPFNITVIQVYAPTSNAEEAEVELFYEDLQDLLELTPKKMSFSL